MKQRICSATSSFVLISSALVIAACGIEDDPRTRTEDPINTCVVEPLRGPSEMPLGGEVSARAISSDGRFVVLESRSTIRTATRLTVSIVLFVFDRTLGTYERLDGIRGSVSMSDDGRFIAYEEGSEVRVLDRQSSQTIVVSANNLGPDVSSCSPTISGDGRFLVFRSFRSDLVAGDINGTADYFRWDRYTGEVIRLNLTNAGESFRDLVSVTLTRDGRYAVVGKREGSVRLFYRDLQAGTSTRLEPGRSTKSPFYDYALDDSVSPRMTTDGLFVAFLVRGRVFFYDRAANHTTELFLDPTSMTTQINTADPRTTLFDISDDGRYLLLGTNVHCGSVASLLILDRTTSQFFRPAGNLGESGRMSNDGGWVAVTSKGSAGRLTSTALTNHPALCGAPPPEFLPDISTTEVLKRSGSYVLNLCNSGCPASGEFGVTITNPAAGLSHRIGRSYIQPSGRCSSAQVLCSALGDPGCLRELTLRVSLDDQFKVREANEENNAFGAAFVGRSLSAEIVP